MNAKAGSEPNPDTLHGKKTPRLLLVGWDAADWRLIEPLLEEGHMPHLAALIESGVYGRLSTINPPLSPMLWTSIATGKRPWKHGVLGFTEIHPLNGTVRPIFSTARKCKAVWNILHQSGKTCHVIGWWPSHPVEPLRGCMVSNLFQQAVAPADKPWPRLPDSVHPPHLHDAFDALRLHPHAIDGDVLRYFVPRAPEIDQKSDRRLLTVAKILAECSTIQAAATLAMTQQPVWDFSAVYFDAIDHFSHAFMAYHPPRLPWVAERDFELYQEVVRAGYVFHDMMLGVLCHLAGPEATVIVLSDHGFHPDHLRPRSVPNEPAGPAAEHAPFGIFVAAGPGIKKNQAVVGATILDITPTLLTLFGLPVGRDMDGLVMTGIFSSTPEISYIDSWEQVDGDAALLPPQAAEASSDPAHTLEALRQMQDLGYIEPGIEIQQQAAAATVRELQYNLARAYEDGGLTAQAMELYKRLWDSWPEESRFGVHLLLSQIAARQPLEARNTLALLQERKDMAMHKAANELEQLIKKYKQQHAQTANPPNTAQQTPDPHRTEENHRKNDPTDHSGQHPATKPQNQQDNAWLQNLPQGERLRLRSLQRRAGRNPLAFEFFEGCLLMLEGRTKEAIPHLEQAAKAQAINRISALFELAEARRRLGQLDAARAHIEEILNIDPTHPVAHFRLGRLHLAAGRCEKAAEHAAQALALRQNFPQAALLGGLARWKQGHLEAAGRLLQRAIELNPVFPAGQAVMAMFCRRELRDELAARRHFQLAREARVRIRLLESGQHPRGKHPGEYRAEFLQGKSSIETSPVQINPPPPQDAQQCILIVTGLPRSGTSMMMQMLAAGGVPVLTDSVRQADENNPRGYFEYEKTRSLPRDNAWFLSEPRGRALKVVSPLIGAVPPPPEGLHYLVIHMHRPVEEVERSQRSMLARLGREGSRLTSEAMRELLQGQIIGALTTLAHWRKSGRLSVLDVHFQQAIREPAQTARLVAWFLQPAFKLDAQSAANAVQSHLYREREQTVPPTT